MSDWDSLAGIFTGIPELPGAACVGRSDLFDPRGDYEPAERARQRHDVAVQICAACPALRPCKAWAGTLDNRRIRGVVAGYIRREPPKSHPTDLEVA